MNRNSKAVTALLTGIALALTVLPAAGAQDWVKNTVKGAVKGQAAGWIHRGVRCAIGQHNCWQKAKAEGKEVVFVDQNGEVIRDAAGEPVTDPADLPPQYRQAHADGASGAPAPTSSTTDANFDFEAGQRILFFTDYSADNLGDFPRQLELVNGNWEVVEWQGRRFLRTTGPRHAAVRIRLPETLPQRFTIETEVYLPHVNHQVGLYTEATDRGHAYRDDAHYFLIGGRHGPGVKSRGRDLPEASERVDSVHEQLTPYRIMVDDAHVKVFVGDRRVANMPRATLVRTDTLQLQNLYNASEEIPILFGPIRIAAGGRDLYDAIVADGRVAIHDILFDVDKATIRPESGPVLAEIAAILRAHPDLELMIEGHTDSTGDFDHNMDLSRRRAESVERWLVEREGIADGRLRTLGLGSTQPRDTNDTEAGRQQNRRVELVNVG